MAAETKGAKVVEVTLSASFDHGQDVIGVPEAFACTATQSPVAQQLVASGASGAAELARGGKGVDAASGAYAAITQEDLIAQICGLGAQLPFVNTEVGAEGKAARWHLERAPAAEAAPVRSARDRFAVDPTALHDAREAHSFVVAR